MIIIAYLLGKLQGVWHLLYMLLAVGLIFFALCTTDEDTGRKMSCEAVERC